MEIEQVRDQVLARLSGAKAVTDLATGPGTRSFLDLMFGERHVVVECCPGGPIGVSLTSEEDGFGEKPVDVFESVEEAVTRAVTLLCQ